MKFSTLSLFGLFAIASGDDARNLKHRTRVPRVKKTELIANLETLVAQLQANLSTVSSQVATATATIASLQANVTGSAATIATLQANVTASMSQISTLTTQASTCAANLSKSFTADQVTTAVYNQLVNEYAYDVFNASTPAPYRTLSRLSNNNAAKAFESAGGLIWNGYNPEAAFFLANSDDDTLVREMQVRASKDVSNCEIISCRTHKCCLQFVSFIGPCIQVS